MKSLLHVPRREAWAKPLLYGALNIASASGIVFANKIVLSTYKFSFTCALTWIHTIFTLAGMRLFLAAGMFPRKQLPQLQVLPLAAAYVGYIVLCNLSLKVNTVGFYQMMKIAVAPTVLLLELLLFKVIPTVRVAASIALVCLGIGIATITDTQLISHLSGLIIGLTATLVTALYQCWAGSKQKQLQASSMQLLDQYTPQASLILGLLTPLMEPVGSLSTPGTLLGYHYTPAAVAAIVLSAVLGLLVSLSTFLLIGCTSSLTYNVVGHLKTVIILTGACIFFGDAMPPKKLLGISVAMAGIIWYTHLKLKQPQTSSSSLPVKSPGSAQALLSNDGMVVCRDDGRSPAVCSNSSESSTAVPLQTSSSMAASTSKSSYFRPNASAFMPYLPGIAAMHRPHLG